MVPQEEYVEEDSQGKTEGGKDPDDKGIQHTEQDRCLLFVLICQNLDVDEELDNGSVAVIRCMLTLWYQLGLQDGVEGQSVDDLARSFGEDDT